MNIKVDEYFRKEARKNYKIKEQINKINFAIDLDFNIFKRAVKK